MDKQIPIYHLKQLYLTAFRKNAMPKAVNSLKSISNIDGIREVVNSIRYIYPTVIKDIEKVLYPRTAKEMSEVSSIFFKPESLVSEINWALAYMKDHWANLRWFAECKEKFEHNLLIGNYELCEKLLVQIKDKLGVSLWYYDARCVLYEYEGKHAELVYFISGTLEECKENKNYIPSLIYNLYERSSRRLSPYKFDEDLNALYKKNKTDLHEDYYKYVLYRLNYYNQYETTDLSLPIMFESLSSLLDRYLIIISVIKSAMAVSIDGNALKSKANYLYKKTNDRALLPILVYTGLTPPTYYYNADYIKILDAYYSGNYQECKEYATKFICADASAFDAYVYYCRSLIYMGQEFEMLHNVSKVSPANEICRRIYKILTYDDVKDNLYGLYQINKNLYSFDIAASLDNFVKVELNDKVNERLKHFQTYHFDPLFSCIYDKKEDALSYINSYENVNGKSLACLVWKKRISKEIIDNKSLPEHITEPINIDYYLNNGMYDDVYIRCEALYKSGDNNVPIRQVAVSKWIEGLFKQKKVQQAIDKYVDFYVKDLPSVAKVDTHKIITYLQDNLYEDIRRNVNLVIFVSLTCKDTVDKSFILFEFCELQGVTVPSELIEKLQVSRYGIERIETFFLLMNDDETLRHYMKIDSYKDRLDERRKILQYLIYLNTCNKDIYQTMLKKVEDSLLVYNLSHNMDESKIYANEEAIINYKLTEIDGLYNRYKLLLDTVIDKHKDVYVVDISGSSFFDNQMGYEKESNVKTSISSNGLYGVFYNLYLEIREQFLNSDYGLVAYLSTRVRHGELEAMLRPEMDQRNLILSMRDNEYQEDRYWRDTYNLAESESNVVNKALIEFSDSFDNAVTILIKQKLQIFDNQKKPEGLFNYDVKEDEIAYKAMEIGLLLKTESGDRTYFCHAIIKWLWEKTEDSLANIRKYIDEDFMQTILSAVSRLESRIQEHMPNGYAKTDILSHIRSAREAITMKITKVSRWFTVSQPKIDDVDFKTVSHQVYNSVRLSHTHCITDDQLAIRGSSFKIKSTYVIHYADIMRNVVSNMFKHGVDAVDGKRHFQLDINITDEDVQINFINDIDGDPQILNSLFLNKINDVKSVSDEGGSGIAKVNKILKRDLDNPHNSIFMNAELGKCYTSIVIKLNGFRKDE